MPTLLGYEMSALAAIIREHENTSHLRDTAAWRLMIAEAEEEAAMARFEEAMEDHYDAKAKLEALRLELAA